MPASVVVVDSAWPADRAVADALDHVIAELRRDPHAMAAAVLTGMRREVAGYAGLAPADARVVEQGVVHTVTTFVTLLVERRRLRPDELEAIAAIGAVRASQGIPVEEMLCAVRVAMRWGWAHILDRAAALPPSPATTAALGRLAAEVFEYMQQSASAMTRGAEDHARRGLLADVRARSKVVEDLLSGSFRSDDELCGLAAAVGLDLTTPIVVLLAALAVAGTGDGDALEPLHRIEDEVFAHFADALDSSVRAVPVPHVALLLQPDAAERAADLAGAAGALVVVGGPATGPAAVHRCYRRGARLIDVARRVGHPAGLVDSRRLAVHRLLGEAQASDARHFVDDVVGPLLALPGERCDRLLAVLEAATTADSTLTEIGARLGIHPKTASARLREVERVTGLHLDRLDDRLLAQVALVLHRLEGRATST